MQWLQWRENKDLGSLLGSAAHESHDTKRGILLYLSFFMCKMK